MQMMQAGEEVGIQFAFTNTSFPNTLRAHALLDFALFKDGGTKQNDVAEMLFKVGVVCGCVVVAVVFLLLLQVFCVVYCYCFCCCVLFVL